MKRPLLLACLLSTFALSVAANDGLLPAVNTTDSATDANELSDAASELVQDAEPEEVVTPIPPETIEKVYPGLITGFAPLFKDPPFGSFDASFLSTPSSGIKLAVLLPADKSALEPYAQSTLKGILAANYRHTAPHEILLVRPEAGASILDQVRYAAEQGATVAIGPLDRSQVDVLAQQEYLPLPVITLNEVDLYHTTPYTDEEIALDRQQQASVLAEETARTELEQLTHQAFPKLKAVVAKGSLSDTRIVPEVLGLRASDDYRKANAEALALVEPVKERFQARIAAKTTVPGLLLAEDVPEKYVRHTDRIFPREMLMMGLSMEHDARYIARLAVEALPRYTETGQRPKVLLIDQDSPLEKRIANAFLDELVSSGHTPDILTVNLKEFRHLSKFFELVVDIPPETLDPSLTEEIDKTADPQAWRQQQLRLNRQLAERRAAAALAEPPYHAVLLALNAKTASLVRSRLPIRSRVWSAPLINPGNPKTDSQAKAMTYDLREVAFVESPFLLHFDAADVEERYRVSAPISALDQRLFALGVDAFGVAERVAHGETSSSSIGLLGRLSFDMEASPLVDRRGQTAMINGGHIKQISEKRAKSFQSVKPGTDPLAKFRKIEAPAPVITEQAVNDATVDTSSVVLAQENNAATAVSEATVEGAPPSPDVVDPQSEPLPEASEPEEPIELLDSPIVLKPSSDAKPYTLPEDYVPIAVSVENNGTAGATADETNAAIPDSADSSVPSDPSSAATTEATAHESVPVEQDGATAAPEPMPTTTDSPPVATEGSHPTSSVPSDASSTTTTETTVPTQENIPVGLDASPEPTSSATDATPVETGASTPVSTVSTEASAITIPLGADMDAAAQPSASTSF